MSNYQEFIYLDHAATSIPRCQFAIAAAIKAMNLGNADRGLHPSATAASSTIATARTAIAKLVGITNNTHTVCFLSSTTAALNQAILGLRPLPRCAAIDPLAHNATYRPLASRSHWILPHDEQGKIDVERLKATWVRDTDVVVITHASNVNGVIQPVAEVIQLAHEFGARVVVDAAQTVGVIDTTGLAAADLIAFGAHKGLRGLPGIGALVVAAGLELEPLIYGGTGGNSSSELMPLELPSRLEAGTANLPAIAAFQTCAENYTQSPQNYQITTADLADAVQSGGGKLLPTDVFNSVPVVSFTVPDIPVWEAADILERCFAIQLRVGLHCAPLAHRTLGTFSAGALRVSAGCVTTPEDLLNLSQAIYSTRKSYGIFGHV